MKFKTLYADPPWLEIGGGRIVRGAQAHYPVMKTADICALQVNGKHVSEAAEENAHLYLWATNNFLPDALKVVAAWGFEYKTMITWVKDRFGLGQYFRGQTEHCLFAVRGNLPYRARPSDGKRAQGVTYFAAPRQEHSRKPEEMRRMIELVSHPAYLELFARRDVPGWSVWGNEVESDDFDDLLQP